MEHHREARRLNTEKRKLREEMLARRRALPHAAMLSAAGSVARHFADHPILSFAPSFAGYRAMRGELDVMEIYTLMERFEKKTALPCAMEDKTLLYRAWKPGDALTRHALGMEEPLPTAPITEPEIILVPLLAFDGEGYRLGYGAGFYDRTISLSREENKNQKFIGVAFSSQEVDEIPTDAHDQPLDGILTELGVSMF